MLSKECSLKAALHDSVMSRVTLRRLGLCSHFNSVRKVREVSGQSVAHLYWSATCCSTRTQSLETRSTTALYWPQAAWRPGWSAHCCRWFFVKSVHSLKNLQNYAKCNLQVFPSNRMGLQSVSRKRLLKYIVLKKKMLFMMSQRAWIPLKKKKKVNVNHIVTSLFNVS